MLSEAHPLKPIHNYNPEKKQAARFNLKKKYAVYLTYLVFLRHSILQSYHCKTLLVNALLPKHHPMSE